MTARDGRSDPGIALIHGAAGGIGAAIVQHLAESAEFSKVIGTVRRTPSTVNDDHAFVNDVRLVQMEATNEQSVHAAAEQVAALNRPVTLMLNCIGLLHNEEHLPEKRLADLNAAHMLDSFSTNAIAPALIMKEFAPLIDRRQRSVIANISAKVGSIADNRKGGWYSYRASKSALNQLTRTAALEFKRSNPRAICIALHPGTVATKLSAPFSERLPAGQVRPADIAAAQLLQVLSRLAPEDNGKFIGWDGAEIPW